MSSTEYFRALEILRAEFLPFVRGGLSELDDILCDVDWSKSPGLPYVNQGCSSKKDAWLKFEPEIRSRVATLLKGEYVECIFIATPKDELLPPGKEARIFCPAPFHHQLACACLFTQACKSLTATVLNHSSAIGLNIFGRGLERSFRRLSQHPFGFDADHKGWDAGYRQGEPERDFMKTGLSDYYHAAVDMVFSLAQCPQVLVQGNVIQMCFQPSGWFLTTVTNTLKNYRQVCEAFMDMYPKHNDDQRCTIDQMRSHLLILAGGDDLAYSTDCSWFNITALAQQVQRRGVYLETDVLEPRDPMRLTFFSHKLYPRYVKLTNSYMLVAGGRLSKHISALSYLKKSGNDVDYLLNASRVVALMLNIWPYGDTFEIIQQYLYHLVHHFFLLSGQVSTPEWQGVFRSMPTDEKMLNLRTALKLESGTISLKEGPVRFKVFKDYLSLPFLCLETLVPLTMLWISLKSPLLSPLKGENGSLPPVTPFTIPISLWLVIQTFLLQVLLFSSSRNRFRSLFLQLVLELLLLALIGIVIYPLHLELLPKI
jgi:hypothetical protein